MFKSTPSSSPKIVRFLCYRAKKQVRMFPRIRLTRLLEIDGDLHQANDECEVEFATALELVGRGDAHDIARPLIIRTPRYLNKLNPQLMSVQLDEPRSMPLLTAVRIIEAGDAVPVLEFPNHPLSIAAESTSIGDAFLHYVEGYPNITRLFAATGLSVNPNELVYLPQQYAKLPSGDLPRPHPPQYSVPIRSRHWWSDVVDDRAEQRNRPPPPQPPFGQRFMEQAARQYFAAAVRWFFEHLKTGAAVALGIAEENLNTYADSVIPAPWWARNIIVDLGRGEIRELSDSNRQGIRFWSEIRLTAPDTSPATRPTEGGTHRLSIKTRVGLVVAAVVASGRATRAQIRATQRAFTAEWTKPGGPLIGLKRETVARYIRAYFGK